MRDARAGQESAGGAAISVAHDASRGNQSRKAASELRSNDINFDVAHIRHGDYAALFEGSDLFATLQPTTHVVGY
jgi:hypothetical protein